MEVEKRSKARDDLRTHCDRLAWKEHRKTGFSPVHLPPVEDVRSIQIKQSLEKEIDGDTYSPILFIHSQPSLTDEMRFLHRLQITHDHIFEEPQGRFASQAVTQPSKTRVNANKNYPFMDAIRGSRRAKTNASK